jgi:hypothetical protein
MTIITECAVRYVTMDNFGNIYEVTNLFDRLGHPTQDPILASTCVIRFNGDWLPQDADDVPIYTVH